MLVSRLCLKEELYQQGPTVQHGELCSMLGGSRDGRGVWGRMGTCICVAESLCCLPGSVTALLISYALIQNKKLKKEKFFPFTDT